MGIGLVWIVMGLLCRWLLTAPALGILAWRASAAMVVVCLTILGTYFLIFGVPWY